MAGLNRNFGLVRRGLLCTGLIVATASAALGATAVGTLSGQFSVDPTGAATYRIPIDVIPGVNGVQPSLALLYNSRKGRGVLGVGWSLKGLSAIARCPATKATFGSVREVDPIFHGIGANSDKFCLDGQALIAESGAYGANGTVYHTEVATFQKIISHDYHGGGPAWFEVYDKAGLIREYGHSAGSVVVDDARNSGADTVIWNLDRIADRNGNYISFVYDDHHQIDRIDYFNNADKKIGSVRFTYQSLSAATAHIGYFAGATLGYTDMLTEIDIYSSGSLARKYKLGVTYDGWRDEHVLNSVQECEANDNCFPATTFAYTPSSTGFVSDNFSLVNGSMSDMKIADVDGDGRPDFVYVANGVWTIRFASDDYNGAVSTSVAAGASPDDALVLDYNGDGRQDLLVPTANDQWQVAVSNGSKLVWSPEVLSNHGSYDKHPLALDITGDGLPEILFKVPDASISGYYDLVFYENTSSGYKQSYYKPGPATTVVSAEERMTPVNANGDSRGDIYFSADGCDQYCTAEGKVLRATKGAGTSPVDFITVAGAGYQRSKAAKFADVNGDGLDDAVIYAPYPYPDGNDMWQVFLNRGDSWPIDPDGFNSQTATATIHPQYSLVADYNHDGRADILVPAANNWVDMQWAGGNTQMHVDPATGPASSAYASAAIIDHDGSGLGDYLYYDGSAWRLKQHKGDQGGLLVGITNGLGSHLDIDYCSIDYCRNIYQPDTATPSDQEVRNLSAPLYVVSAIQTDSGNGKTLRTTYQYQGAKLDQWGRGFLGFTRIQADNSAAGITTATQYRLDFPYTGIATSSSKAPLGDSAPFVKTTNTLASRDDGHGVFPFVESSTAKYYTLNSHQQYKQVATSYTYDDWDNALSTVVTTSGSGQSTYAVETTNTYDNNTSNWCLGRLRDTRVQHTLGGQSVTRESSFTYDSGNCQLKSETVEPNNATLELTTTYTFDGFGNRKTKTVSGAGIASRATTTSYDANGRFPVSVTDPLGHTSHMTWDARRGVKLSTIDPNGLKVNYRYDGFGRKAGSSGPFPASATSVAYASCTGRCAYKTTATQAGGETATTEYDDKGRKIRTTRTGLNGQLVYQDFYYDVLGRAYLVSAPYYSGQTRCWTYTAFDTLNRPTDVWQAAKDEECAGQGGGVPAAGSPPGAYSAHVQTAYDGLKVTVTDPKGNTTIRQNNLLGKVASTTDAAGHTTTYTYKPAGNIAAKTLPNGAATSMTYDIAGNKLTTSSSDSGNWSYSYDALGELISQTNPSGQTVTQGYDKLGRLVSRTEPQTDGTSGTTTWTYDTAAHGIGKLAEEQGADGFIRSYSYTQYAQLKDVATTIDGASYVVSHTYDAYGRPATVNYPKSAPPPADETPTATVSASATRVVIGTAVTLTGSASDPDSGPQPLAYLWKQLSGSQAVGVTGNTGTSVTFTATQPGTYTFKFYAGDGQIAGSDTISIAVTPKPPTLTRIEPKLSINGDNFSIDGDFKVYWDGSNTGATSYKLYEHTEPYGGSPTDNQYPNLDGDHKSFHYGNGTYTYQIVGCAAGVCSPLSNSLTENVTLPPGPPGAPQITQNGQPLIDGSKAIGPQSGAVIDISWSAPTSGEVTGYKLYQRDIPSDTTTHSPFSGTSASASLPGDLHTYEVWVEACNGPSPLACTASAHKTIKVYLKPGTPTISAPVYSTGVYTVRWEASQTGWTDSFRLYESVNGGAYNIKYTGPGTSAEYTHYDNGYTYSYRVYAYNGPARSDHYAQASIQIWRQAGIPSPVTVPTYSNSDGSYTVSWGSGGTFATYYQYAESDEYDAERDVHIYGPTYYAGTARSKTFTHSSGKWYYRVRACNHVSVACSGWAESANGVIVKKVAEPGSIWLSSSYGTPGQSYTIYWDAASGASNYQLSHKVNSGAWGGTTNVGNVTHVGKTVYSYLSVGDTLSWRVRACNGSLCSAWRGTATMQILAGGGGGGGGGGGSDCPPNIPDCKPRIVQPAPMDVTPPADSGETSSTGDGSGPLSFNTAGLPSSLPLPPGEGWGKGVQRRLAAAIPYASGRALQQSVIQYAPTTSAWYRQLKLRTVSATTTTPATTGSGYHLTLRYRYDAYGHLVHVAGNDPTHPYWSAKVADAAGHVTGAVENNGIGIARVYDQATGALRRMSAGDVGNVNDSHVQFAAYQYDANGNLTSCENGVTGQTETYAYNSRNQLTGAQRTLNGISAATLSASYDSAGNIIARNGTSYSYAAGHPNRLTSLAGNAYQYDAAGRVLTGKDNLSVGWTAFGKPYTLSRDDNAGTTHNAQFWYDPERSRYKQVVDGTQHLYLAGGTFEIIHTIGGVDTTYRMAIVVAGSVIGQLETNTNGTSATRYFYRDVLGSVTVIADSQGTVTQRLAYGPYGTHRDATNWNQPLSITTILGLNLPTDRGYTGQHDLTALNLVDYGGRIYSPTLGRFLSPDPTGAEANPYVYARNNPETFTDPSGYFSLGDLTRIAVVATFAYVTGGAAAFEAGGWGTLGGSLAGGATGGFTAGFLASGGDFRAGFLGATGGAAMGGLGFAFGPNPSGGVLVGRAVAEGAVGGVLSTAGGGRFGDGFLGAFASSMAGPSINGIGGGSLDAASIAERIAASAALGATVSALNGGSAANGAISAAFQRLFNDRHTIEARNAAAAKIPDKVTVMGKASASDVANANKALAKLKAAIIAGKIDASFLVSDYTSGSIDAIFKANFTSQLAGDNTFKLNQIVVYGQTINTGTSDAVIIFGPLGTGSLRAAIITAAHELKHLSLYNNSLSPYDFSGERGPFSPQERDAERYGQVAYCKIHGC